jgi:hypothetical protein
VSKRTYVTGLVSYFSRTSKLLPGAGIIFWVAFHRAVCRILISFFLIWLFLILAVSATRMHVMDRYDLSSDPCDYQMIRFNNMIQVHKLSTLRSRTHISIFFFIHFFPLLCDFLFIRFWLASVTLLRHLTEIWYTLQGCWTTLLISYTM